MRLQETIIFFSGCQHFNDLMS